VSVICFGLTAYASARLVVLTTGSALGATTAALLLMLNPNLLYLQATPMTEPLLLATTFLSVLWLYEWVAADTDEVPWRLRLALFAAAWTRYEAWLVIAAALVAAVHVWLRRSSTIVVGRPEGRPLRAVVRRARRVAVWPAVAVAVFLINSRITVGAWFVDSGFYVIDPVYAGLAWKSFVAVWWGTHQLSGYVVEAVALGTAALFLVRALGRTLDAVLAIPVALLASAALPFYAFYQGHPFRIRYMIPAVAACAVFGGAAVGLTRAAVLGPLLAVVLVGSLVIESPLWDGNAPMIVEAQLDVPHSLNRRAVTACLAREYRGGTVMASMGSLAHYMQELSAAGFDIADFLNEGNGAIWELALETGPAPHAGWMLVEEEAEGGDVLAQRIRHDPAFAHGMSRVCEGGGVALYRRETVGSSRQQAVGEDHATFQSDTPR
jgi:hypothetical protein